MLLRYLKGAQVVIALQSSLLSIYKSSQYHSDSFNLLIRVVRNFSTMSEEAVLLRKAENRTFPGFDKESQSKWSGPFHFIQGADTQFGMIDNYILKKENPKWDNEVKLTTKAIEAINAMDPPPKFFVVCGDLIDAMPGNALKPGQTEAFIKVFSKLNPDIPLVCVCGNHDIGDIPTPEAVQEYRQKFGDDYFVFYCAGVMFIVINSQFYENASKVTDLAAKQDEWLDERLKEAKLGYYKHVIIFQHIPWFVKDPSEEKIYFNFEIELRTKMLEKFHNSNIRAIFCGHYHRNAGGFYKNMEIIVTSAVGAQLGSDKSGFRIVRVLDDSIQHKYYDLDNVPKIVTL